MLPTKKHVSQPEISRMINQRWDINNGEGDRGEGRGGEERKRNREIRNKKA